MIDIRLFYLLSGFEQALQSLDKTKEPDQKILLELEQDPLTAPPGDTFQRLRGAILGIQQICGDDAALRAVFARELKPVVKRSGASGPERQSTRPKLLLFVHGIFSSGNSAFGTMDANFSQEPRFSATHLAFFDYDYNMGILDNGQQLATRIAALSDGLDVILICHSMGGLVARAAVLNRSLPSVKKAFLIGTPNFGALKTANFGLLSGMTFALTRKVYGVFRKPGLADLTRVSQIFKRPIDHGKASVRDIEYVTIPGTFFHKDRAPYEISDGETWKGAFQGLDMGLQLWSAYSGLFRITLERPHDGIVEEQSNRLVPEASAHHSEKYLTLTRPKLSGYTYAHIVPVVSDELVHVKIQHDPNVIELVKELVLAGNSHDFCTTSYSGSLAERIPFSFEFANPS